MLNNSGKILTVRAVTSGEFSEIASLSEPSASIAVSVSTDVVNGFNCIRGPRSGEVSTSGTPISPKYSKIMGRVSESEP